MVEQNAVGGEQAIRLPVVLHGPIGIQLGHCIRRSRIERRGLPLRHLLHLAVQFGRRGLVEPDALLQPDFTYRLQKPHRPHGVYLAREVRHVERDAHMALRGEVVHFVGLYRIDEVREPAGVRQIAIMQEQRLIVDFRIRAKMVYPLPIETGRPPDDAVDLVSLAQEKLGQIASVLARDSRYQCFFHFDLPFTFQEAVEEPPAELVGSCVPRDRGRASPPVRFVLRIP